MPPEYKYHKLRTDTIRIFKLSPGLDQAQISGCFLTRSLRSKTSYEAISYTWGSSKDVQDVFLEKNLRLSVPSRVVKILRNLRSPHSSRLIWIDAICINQQDNLERSEQVRFMRRVYSEASMVRVWLDVEMAEDDWGLDMLTKLTRVATSEPSLDFDSEGWQRVYDIINHAYWTRMWVQQELSSAKRLTIQCQGIEIPVFGLLQFHRLTYEGYAREDTNNVEKFKIGMNPQFTYALDVLSRQQIAGNQPAHENVFAGGHQYYLIFDALERCRRFKATDPRDKLFALEGAIRSWEIPSAVINYNLSVCQVYLEIAKHMIQRWQSYAFLCDCNIDDVTDQDSLPSWLPDYSITAPKTLPFAAVKGKYPFDYRFLKEPTLSNNDSILHVQGFRIDKILIPYRQLSHENILHRLTAQELFAALEDMVTTALELREGKRIIDTAEPDSELDKFGLILEQQAMAFSLLYGGQPEEELEERLLEFAKQREFLDSVNEQRKTLHMSYSSLLRVEGDKFCSKPASVEWAMVTQMRGRTFYLSKRGNMGLAPSGIRAGDEIWEIPGCQWSIVLRSTGNSYVVIGPSYHAPSCFRPDVLFENLENLDSINSGTELDGMCWSNSHGTFKIETIQLQ